ncbi:unnamed protein product [Didymodactylos carnosus]|uniref:Uncharacterized protein n=1 Tax=Didymodactylos carnosus TaxID=1234261 RepID=A0A815TLF4_9BILA|nr:unnamed protein product [Didymodactylos carnosus]CAF4368803.1 unnamed protein product [Didymodactylos carnosus]
MPTEGLETQIERVKIVYLKLPTTRRFHHMLFKQLQILKSSDDSNGVRIDELTANADEQSVVVCLQIVLFLSGKVRQQRSSTRAATGGVENDDDGRGVNHENDGGNGGGF